MLICTRARPSGVGSDAIVASWREALAAEFREAAPSKIAPKSRLPPHLAASMRRRMPALADSGSPVAATRGWESRVEACWAEDVLGRPDANSSVCAGQPSKTHDGRMACLGRVKRS
eukprot:CAMPEP_0179977210 /NCGR_PEP_ID=MMETSP0983-20121128/39918_1 /TAXON_ID=483367 /ORGANISM="non described non described, Strain CCMP 2436" /LENGTH=115 /DNA_ID=CAMNT_0021894343 /DNA_START=47 /DNA_END=392 /DNA_ORIENTATION=-